ncbi:hypothetical protein [Paracoccus beibuensis]|uniref:hypothetical protein n=1 Tax=Paracoccus beibuensis TaxID=547602 RepID=UPI00223F5F62|nr:hypothetical protein [Paracoccus beibuensis]
MTRRAATADTITVHVPFRVVKRGGRKEMEVPTDIRARSHCDDALIKALARAFRWKKVLESGEFGTIAELARSERMAAPFLTRTMRLTQLVPDLVEGILDGSQPPSLKLEALRGTLPRAWSEQRAVLNTALD